MTESGSRYCTSCWFNIASLMYVEEISIMGAFVYNTALFDAILSSLATGEAFNRLGYINNR